MEQIKNFSSETPKSKEEIEQQRQFLLNLNLILSVYDRVIIPKNDIDNIIDKIENYLKEKEPNMPEETLGEITEMMQKYLKNLSGNQIYASDVLRVILKAREKTWYGSIIYMLRKFLEISKEYLNQEYEEYKNTVDEVLILAQNELKTTEFFKVLTKLLIGPYNEDYLMEFKERANREIKELNKELERLNKELERM
jgi:CRISPR/Cas system-associated protein endoribonuclease Cas2